MKECGKPNQGRTEDNGFDGDQALRRWSGQRLPVAVLRCAGPRDSMEDNVMALTSFPANKDRLGKTVGRIMKLTQEYIEKCAAACYEDVIMDMTATPEETDPKNLASCPRTLAGKSDSTYA